MFNLTLLFIINALKNNQTQTLTLTLIINNLKKLYMT